MRTRLITILFSCAVLAAPAHAKDGAKDLKTALTVYSSAAPGSVQPQFYRDSALQPSPWANGGVPGFAVVRETRAVSIPEKQSTLQFTDVAALIDPTTVSFRSLTAPESTTVLEQNFLYDLVSQQKLLERYIGQNITVEQQQGDAIGKTEGKLLSAQGGITLETADKKVLSLQNYSNLLFPTLPGGLMTKPTLQWLINTDKPGEHQVETTYQTEGMSWWADYNANFTPEKNDGAKGTLDLSAWVSIVNQSGASFNDAQLKLVAGDVHRAPAPAAPMMMKARTMEMAASSDAAGFTQSPLFEYHLYTLGRATTLPDKSTKQIELFPAVRNIPVEKIFVYQGTQNMYYGGINTGAMDGTEGTRDVQVFLQFKNTKDHGLGIPLPAGRVRVNQWDIADNSLQLVGEDIIDHTPKEDTLLLKMGNAFDVKGARKITHFSSDDARRRMSESVEVTLTNQKESSVEVQVREPLYRGQNWKITEKSSDFTKLNAQMIQFPITVKPGETKRLTYTVEYTW